MTEEVLRFHIQKMRQYSFNDPRYQPVIALVEWALQQEWVSTLHLLTSHEHAWLSLPGSKFDKPAFTVDNRNDERDFIDGFRYRLIGENGSVVLDRWCSPVNAKSEFVSFVHSLRCISKNVVHPVTFDPKCLTPTVKQLAQAIYDDRNFAQLPILADMLQEAGCDQEDVLKHLRGGGEHVRGCWALDLVLGRE